MNDDTIQDLKQFISATISQQTTGLASKEDITSLEENIASLDKKLSGKIDDLASFVAEALDNTNETTHTQLKDHDERITRLEQKVA